jgi:hypothetical protein
MSLQRISLALRRGLIHNSSVSRTSVVIDETSVKLPSCIMEAAGSQRYTLNASCIATGPPSDMSTGIPSTVSFLRCVGHRQGIASTCVHDLSFVGLLHPTQTCSRGHPSSADSRKCTGPCGGVHIAHSLATSADRSITIPTLCGSCPTVRNMLFQQQFARAQVACSRRPLRIPSPLDTSSLHRPCWRPEFAAAMPIGHH